MSTSIVTALHGMASTIFSNLFIKLPYPETETNLSEHVVVVTGSNTGLGLEASRHLLRLGVGKLIMAVRNLEKGDAARKELLESTKREPASVEVWELDMSSYVSVKSFAQRATKDLPRLNAVLANAGIFTFAFDVAEENEKTVTVNVVSTFLLLLLLLPKLREAPSTARFVIPNSAMHYWAPIKELVAKPGETSIFSRLNDPKRADMSRYQVTKLLVLYAMRELTERMRGSEKGAVVVNSPNPSYCKSGLVREVEGIMMRIPEKLLARSTEMGSRALVHGVITWDETHGQYLTNCHVQRYVSCFQICSVLRMLMF